MIKKHMLALLFITLISYLFIGAAYSGASLYIDDLKVLHDKTFPIKPGKQLKVKTTTGDVEVIYWDESKVYIKILGDDDAEERINFEFKNDDNLVEIIAHKDGSLFSWFSGIDLKYEIKVPANFNVDVSTSGGDIKLGGVNGTARLHTSGGDVSCNLTLNNATKLSGHKIIADLNNGGINFNAHTSGGDIDVVKK